MQEKQRNHQNRTAQHFPEDYNKLSSTYTDQYEQNYSDVLEKP